MIKDFKKKIKVEINVLLGRITPIKKEIVCNHHWYGNEYGGFFVHPDALNKDSIVYSFGIGEDISFDRAVIENHECRVFGFDPTPKSIEWVANQELPPLFVFSSYGIDSQTGCVNFNLPKNKEYVSGSAINHKNVNNNNTVSVRMKSLRDICSDFGHNHIDILKMDIEGSEYQIIEDILASPVTIDQILIEIHERFFDDGKLKTYKLLNSLTRAGYVVFAVSKTMEEISFIRKELMN